MRKSGKIFAWILSMAVLFGSGAGTLAAEGGLENTQTLEDSGAEEAEASEESGPEDQDLTEKESEAGDQDLSDEEADSERQDSPEDQGNAGSSEEQEDQEGEEIQQEDEELDAYISEASKALEEIAGKETLMALVYLCDSYPVKKTPEADGENLISLPSGSTVFVTGMDVDADLGLWFRVRAEYGGSVCEGYIEKGYLAYSNELLTEWEENYFPRRTMFAARARAVSYPDVEQFPESYRDKLMRLKQAHPNWIFVRQNTNLDWESVVRNEDYRDRSLVHSSMGAAYKGKLYGAGWYYATNGAVRYYLDPRNFLEENRIFQFEQLTYNPSYHSQAAVQNILNNTFMKGQLPGAGMTYAEAFFKIGVSLRVSPFHLACRVYQEQGVDGTSALISGTYDGVPAYKGYYNYYNIGASGATTREIVESGLARAVKEGWNSPYASLRGGAEILSANYILRGQDTLYLQKFDVDASDGTLYTHQYMQNITAPYTESLTVKNAYIRTNSLDNSFVFKIPVYNNMPSTACPVPTAIPTPTLKPTATPTATPTVRPTASPTATPTVRPTASPTATSTTKPMTTPTAKATVTPSGKPTAMPSAMPSAMPTATPVKTPTAAPAVSPTAVSTVKPHSTTTPAAASSPRRTVEPTASATAKATATPTARATTAPTYLPVPTASTATIPTAVPSGTPRVTATVSPDSTASPSGGVSITRYGTMTPKPTEVSSASPSQARPTVPAATPSARATAVPTSGSSSSSGSGSDSGGHSADHSNSGGETGSNAETGSGNSGTVTSGEASGESNGQGSQNGENSASTAAPGPVSVTENTSSAGVTVAAATPKAQTASEDQEALIMDVSKTGMIFAQTLSQIKEQGMEVVLQVDDKISWSIDGGTIEGDEFEDINLKVTLGESGIPRDLLEILVEDERYVEMSLDHEGELGLTAQLSVKLDEGEPDEYASLFYYNEEAENFEFMCASRISSTGSASFEFRHASDYVIIISGDTKEMLLAEKAGELEACRVQMMEAMAQAKEELPAREPVKAAWIIALILLASAAAGVGIYLIFRRGDR